MALVEGLDVGGSGRDAGGDQPIVGACSAGCRSPRKRRSSPREVERLHACHLDLRLRRGSWRLIVRFTPTGRSSIAGPWRRGRDRSAHFGCVVGSVVERHAEIAEART